jgi:hypothetical protein
MDGLHQALRGAHSGAKARALARHDVLICGAGGALGAEVVEQALARGAFGAVHVLATRAFHATTRGLEPLRVERFDAPAAVALPRLALVVFDRPRHANGRDAAFVRIEPDQLPALARWLHAGGVRELVIVMPHAQASLPEALKAGLASLDEQAVAALGFERLVIVRSARAPDALASRGLQRVADAVLAQLRLMTPQHQQPLRVRKVAQIAVTIARMLHDHPPGTRVLAPEQAWHAAQQKDPAPLLAAWLGGAGWPEIGLRAGRM